MTGQSSNGILVIRYRKLGDTLMVTPVIESLAKETGRPIFTIGERAWEKVFSSMPTVKGGELVSGGEPSRFELIQCALRARRFHCDTALVLRFSDRAAMLARLAGCKRTVGSVGRRRLTLTPLDVNVYSPEWDGLHQVEKYYRVAEAAVEQPLPRLPTSFLPAVEERASAFQSLGPLPDAYACVHLGNGGSNLAWPDASSSELVRALKSQGIMVVATGDARDRETYRESCAIADFDLVGKTGLVSLAEVFRRAKVVVASDGGGPRLSSAVGTPVVILSLGTRWAREVVQPWMAPGVVLEPDRSAESPQSTEASIPASIVFQAAHQFWS